MGFRACCIFRGAGKAAALFLGVLATPSGGFAAPLDKEACDKLQTERQALTVLGVDKEYAKGADWAKANLGQGELNNLKRYITIDEQLKFRCGMVVVSLTVPADEPEDGDDEDGGPTGAGIPMPERRDQPAIVKPEAPAKTKPAATKAQSSFDAETSVGKTLPANAETALPVNAETIVPVTRRIAPAGMVPETIVPKAKTAPQG